MPGYVNYWPFAGGCPQLTARVRDEKLKVIYQGASIQQMQLKCFILIGNILEIFMKEKADID